MVIIHCGSVPSLCSFGLKVFNKLNNSFFLTLSENATFSDYYWQGLIQRTDILTGAIFSGKVAFFERVPLRSRRRRNNQVFCSDVHSWCLMNSTVSIYFFCQAVLYHLVFCCVFEEVKRNWNWFCDLIFLSPKTFSLWSQFLSAVSCLKKCLISTLSTALFSFLIDSVMMRA